MQVNDGVITKSGQVIQTNPADYIFAMKNPLDLVRSQNTSSQQTSTPIIVTFEGGIHVTVTEGNAQKAGESFARSFADSFASRVARQMLHEGYA